MAKNLEELWEQDDDPQKFEFTEKERTAGSVERTKSEKVERREINPVQRVQSDEFTLDDLKDQPEPTDPYKERRQRFL